MLFPKFHFALIVIFSCIFLNDGLPTSLVEDVKDNEIRNVKVKRAHDGNSRFEKFPRESTSYVYNPTAIKRGTSINDGWNNEDAMFQNSDIPSSLYDSGQLDDKTIAEYEKSYRYATDKGKLDTALENAILKSEDYGDPVSINQYRYYGSAVENNRRRRSNVQKIRYAARLKRDANLSPEDILTLFSLWERQHPQRYRTWQRINTVSNMDKDISNNFEEVDDDTDDDETWLDSPVYPHAISSNNPILSNYYYDKPQNDKLDLWSSTADSKRKRYMIARKKSDPTHELRYLNGPKVNDYYTFSQLLENQREPNLRLYHKHIL